MVCHKCANAAASPLTDAGTAMEKVKSVAVMVSLATPHANPSPRKPSWHVQNQ